MCSPTSPVASAPLKRDRRRTSNRFSVERQIFFYSHLVTSIRYFSLCELALTFGALRLQQVAAASVATQHFAGRSHLKAFGDRLLCFASRNRFWHREPGMYLRDMDWQPEFFLEMGGRASVPSVQSFLSSTIPQRKTRAWNWSRRVSEFWRFRCERTSCSSSVEQICSEQNRALFEVLKPTKSRTSTSTTTRTIPNFGI